VLNVGAGTGSYEPTDRSVTAVEPSASMRNNRPLHLSAAIDARAELLPFADASFDAAMATFSIHQWKELGKGLAEMRRVTRGPVVLLTCDPDRVSSYWLADYAPEVLDVEARRYPRLSTIEEGLGGTMDVIPIPIPLDCTDGFNEAYYGRPHMLLDAEVRLACSAWSIVTSDVVDRFERDLSDDLASGAWDERLGYLRTTPEYAGSLVLIVSTP
jgi:SAM-dependent methyltransferase